MKETESLKLLLKELKLKAIAESFEQLSGKAQKDRFSYEQFLHHLCQIEIDDRRNKKVARLLKASGLPMDKTFATFELNRIPNVSKALIGALSKGDFVERKENLLVFGSTGAGKSHLSCAIGNELVNAVYSVLYINTGDIVQKMLAAKKEYKLHEAFKKLDKFRCIILDDIGYVKQNREEMDVLFNLLARRYERSSVIITTNLAFSKWDQIFQDPMTTAAAIDRLVHHSTIMELNVESYRMQEAKKRVQKQRGKSKK